MNREDLLAIRVNKGDVCVNLDARLDIQTVVDILTVYEFGKHNKLKKIDNNVVGNRSRSWTTWELILDVRESLQRSKKLTRESTHNRRTRRQSRESRAASKRTASAHNDAE